MRKVSCFAKGSPSDDPFEEGTEHVVQAQGDEVGKCQKDSVIKGKKKYQFVTDGLKTT